MAGAARRRPDGPPARPALAWLTTLSLAAAFLGIVVLTCVTRSERVRHAHAGVVVTLFIGLPLLLAGLFALDRVVSRTFPGRRSPGGCVPISSTRPTRT